MKSKYPTINLESLIILALTAFCICLAWLRLSYGVELTDEAFAIAEAKIVSDGAIPIVNNWTQAPGFTLLTFWLIPLYRFFTGGLDGIVIFMRQAMLVFKLLVLSSIFFTLKKHIKPKPLALFLIALIPWSPHSIFSPSYNELSLWLLFLSGCLLVASLLEDLHKKECLFSCVSGAVMALSVLAYPAQIVNALILGMTLLFFLILQKKPLDCFCAYCISGLSIATIVTILLATLGSGFESIAHGIKMILSSNYFKIERLPILEILKGTFGAMIRPMLLFFICALLVYLFLNLCEVCSKHLSPLYNLQLGIKQCALLSFLVTQLVFICYIIWRFRYNNAVVEYLSGVFVVTPLIYLTFIHRHRKLCAKLLCFAWVPSILFFVVTIFSSWSPSMRWYCVFISSALSILFSYLAILETFVVSVKIVKNVVAMLPYILSALYITGALVNSYFYVYRDESLSRLTTKVECGVYRGLITTEQRASGVVALEDELRSKVFANDTVLFMETVPMAYLMTDARACTPSTWDMMLYSYGFNDDRIMQEYFQVVDRIPNKIVYIHSGRDDILSIDIPEYRFTKFVNEYYVLAYKNNNLEYPVRIYERK